MGKKVANATLANAIQESGLKPVADIFLEEVDFQEPNQKVSYSVSFEVPPDFELANIEWLEVEIEKIEFNEDLVKKEDRGAKRRTCFMGASGERDKRRRPCGSGLQGRRYGKW